MSSGRQHLRLAVTAGAAPAAETGVFGHVREVLELGVTVGDLNITLGSVLAAILLLLAFLVLSAVLRRGLRRYGSKHDKLSQSSLYTIERLLHYLLLVIGILWALTIAGIPMSQMAVFAGALGVGLGFGLQAIFNNFVSGLILLFDRSLKVGDFVELQSGVHGHVREIRIRFTRISTNDDIDILVPNSEFVSGRVVNWTLNDKSRRMRINFHVALDADAETVKRAGLEVPFTLTQEGHRAPQVWLNEFGESALEFQLVVWLNADATRRPSTVKAAYNWALLQALDRHGVTIPWPQRSVHMVDADAARRAHTGRRIAVGKRQHSDHGDNDAVRDVEREIAEHKVGEHAAAATETNEARDRGHGQDD